LTAVTSLSPANVERLSVQFHDAFRCHDPGQDTFAPDVFVDLNVPLWRFQLQGREAFAAWLRSLAHGEVHIQVQRSVATATGFVTEHVQREHVAGGQTAARRLWLCEVADNRITEVVGYCSGVWDQTLQTRHAAEAPMLRP